MDGLRPQSKQLLDASAGGKIKLKTLEEAMELIENMVASDHTILCDRTYAPTKTSLLELTTQDATLAQNKLLSQQIEALTETLNKLPQQLQVVGGCHICGGTHESGLCMVQDDASNEDHDWRYYPSNNFNQGGSPYQHPSQGPIQISQFAQEKAKRPTRTFGANTEKNPKEECKAILTRSQKRAQEEGEVEEDQYEEGRTNKDEKKEEEGEKKEEKEKNEEKAQQW
ncbi:hypothetical protein HKD37_08G023473 [Glycine soja]